MSIRAATGSLGPRPLGRLTEMCRDGALVLIGVGFLDWVVLVLVLSWARQHWWSMPAAAVIFTLGFLAVDAEGRSLIRKVEGRSEPVDDGFSLQEHPTLLLTATRAVLLIAVLTVALVVASHQWNLGFLTAILPAELVAFGVLGWTKADRVRGWERLHESEVLVSVSGHLRLKVKYFLRPLAD